MGGGAGGAMPIGPIGICGLGNGTILVPGDWPPIGGGGPRCDGIGRPIGIGGGPAPTGNGAGPCACPCPENCGGGGSNGAAHGGPCNEESPGMSVSPRSGERRVGPEWRAR